MPKAKYSPCIKVCEYDDESYCLGCQRTAEEVTIWRDRTEEEQLAGIEMLITGRRKGGVPTKKLRFSRCVSPKQRDEIVSAVFASSSTALYANHWLFKNNSTF